MHSNVKRIFTFIQPTDECCEVFCINWGVGKMISFEIIVN